MKLSGYICFSNVIQLDYCLALSARSLMPIVDELILCDLDSTDETPMLLKQLSTEHPCVRILNYPIRRPENGDGSWMEKWLNWVRGHCSHEMQFYLEADEVVSDDPECHSEIRRALSGKPIEGCRWFNRLNFWQDGRHLAPSGSVVSDWVARMGPSCNIMVLDGPNPEDTTILKASTKHHALKLFHLGFVRRNEAFVAKSKIVQKVFTGGYDARIDQCESMNTPLSEFDWGFKDRLVKYDGEYPKGVREWLLERGRL
jgi:hypothetical protein